MMILGMGMALMAGGAGLLGGALIGDAISDSNNDAYADGGLLALIPRSCYRLSDLCFLRRSGYNDVGPLALYN
jgi:hypothetical protein